MLVTIDELSKTSLYREIVETITRGDSESAELHILSAESLVRSYMSKYGCNAIFGTADAPPTYTGASVELIKKVVKIIASYYLARMANPNIDIELLRLDYQDALKWLQELQKGDVNPDLPYLPDNPNTPEDASASDVSWHSNFKRQNHF
ncbi:MAG: DUF1320 domain-containing protein [Prevotellaceae bacterium]|jgi:hypothetical protein|nr:DUF1320 domain-containing protein [Prevotellaceae bacterium]